MHDQALMRDLMGRIVELAEEEGATGVTRIAVRLGALSHVTPEHFLQHFEDAACGTVAEGASVDATLDGDTTGPNAQGVVLESVELELDSEREAEA
jgi:hydrogenase nickel incorporation protein HypA/HybF